MSHEHWGLGESPFSSAEDRFFYRSANTEEALARLQFLVEHRRRLGLLLGAAGVGKSRLLAMFARNIKRTGRQVAVVSALGVGPAELLGEVARAFGVSLSATAPSATAWRAIDDFFAASRYQALDSVLIVDDADESEPAAVQQLGRLAQNLSAGAGGLSMVLVGRESQLGVLGARLLSLAELRIDLEPWQAADTGGFLQQALAAAGGKNGIFTPAAVARLHQLSGGVPRRVKQLAELCLLAGAGAGAFSIDTAMVESVFRELGVVTPSAALA